MAMRSRARVRSLLLFLFVVLHFHGVQLGKKLECLKDKKQSFLGLIVRSD